MGLVRGGSRCLAPGCPTGPESPEACVSLASFRGALRWRPGWAGFPCRQLRSPVVGGRAEPGQAGPGLRFGGCRALLSSSSGFTPLLGPREDGACGSPLPGHTPEPWKTHPSVRPAPPTLAFSMTLPRTSIPSFCRPLPMSQPPSPPTPPLPSLTFSPCFLPTRLLLGPPGALLSPAGACPAFPSLILFDPRSRTPEAHSYNCLESDCAQ